MTITHAVLITALVILAIYAVAFVSYVLAMRRIRKQRREVINRHMRYQSKRS